MKRRELLEARYPKPTNVPHVVQPRGSFQLYDDDDVIVNKKNMEMGRRIANFIKKNAQPWLSQVNPTKFVLYRGLTHHADKAAFIQAMPADRRPRDTDSVRHRAFNAMIKAAGGYANRSNAIFAIRTDDKASSYGEVYVVVPLGKFRYTYSPEWDDWTAIAPDGLTGSTADPGGFVELLGPAAISKILVLTMPGLIRNKNIDLSHLKRYLGNIDIADPKQIEAKRSRAVKLIQDYDSELIGDYKGPWMGNFPKPIAELLFDPASYEPKIIRKHIRADRDLGLLPVEAEIMIAAPRVLHVEYRVFHDLVAPNLKAKKK